jgi:hypothetical protein
MEREKQIEEMAKIIDDNHGFIVSSVETAEHLYNAGYRKKMQGECEYCKTGEEKCETCTEFYKNIDDRCSGYNDGKCIKYTPVKYCFNCGAYMTRSKRNE